MGMRFDKVMAEAKPVTANTARVFGLIIALALGDFLYLRVMEGWTSFWLFKDAQEGIALITGESPWGHGVVLYQYSVGQSEYTGKSHRNIQNPQYQSVPIGGKSIVYFSASHPWISSLNMPRTLIEGLPVVFVVLIFEAFAVFTVIRPTGSWAFNFMSGNKPLDDQNKTLWERRDLKTKAWRGFNWPRARLFICWLMVIAVVFMTARWIGGWAVGLLGFSGFIFIIVSDARISRRRFLWAILTTRCPQCEKWPLDFKTSSTPENHGLLICEKCRIEWDLGSNTGTVGSYNNNDLFKNISENIEKQLLSGEPPQMRQTFERLQKEGHSANEARRIISAPAVVEAFYIVCYRKPDNERYAWNLKRLPEMPWDAQGKEIYRA